MKNSILEEIRPLVCVFLLFIVSVIVRWEMFRNASFIPTQTDSQLGLSHEIGIPFAKNMKLYRNEEVFNHDLYMLQIYDSYPISTHGFASYIWDDPRYVKPRVESPLRGTASIYTSFPPPAFIAAYATLKTFGMSLTNESMQLFGLGLHFVTALIAFYLARALAENSSRRNLIGVLGASIYLFSTLTLHFHMNVYWSHQFFQPLWLGILLVFVQKKSLLSYGQCFGFSFLSCLIVCTGITSSAGLFCFYLFRTYQTGDRTFIKRAACLMIGGATAQALIAMQNMWLSGITPLDYAYNLTQRATARSTNSLETLVGYSKFFFYIAATCYGGYALLLGLLSFQSLRQSTRTTTSNSLGLQTLFVASFPLLESFFLLRHDCQYAFGQLKWLVPIIVGTAITAESIKNRFVLIGLYLIPAVFHVWIYWMLFAPMVQGRSPTPVFFTPAQGRTSLPVFYSPEQVSNQRSTEIRTSLKRETDVPPAE